MVADDLTTSISGFGNEIITKKILNQEKHNQVLFEPNQLPPMRKIYYYLTSFWQEEVKWPYLLFILVFLFLCIFFQYKYHLTAHLINPYKESAAFFFVNVLFYSIPLFFAVLTYIYFYKRHDLFNNTGFWLILLFIICSFSFRIYLSQRIYWITGKNNTQDIYIYMCARQFLKAFVVFLLVFLYWKFSGHSKIIPLYGFKLKGFDTKPYFQILLIVLPLIILASSQADFLARYPTIGPILGENTLNPELLSKIGIYEFLYGSDYVATELFFRGFVIYLLAGFLGKGAIIPMATMYVFIHFGKPLGETVSSFFGGIILGIIAYETKSILGGIIVHCGIAYMMEVGGFIGNLLYKS